ncbi:hypothetical protein RV16_GL001845 [Enterococcus saccharolyticus]|nr:hypothetical protein RV16_GL001845 [Enterococcus saccharolyticus]
MQTIDLLLSAHFYLYIPMTKEKLRMLPLVDLQGPRYE